MIPRRLGTQESATDSIGIHVGMAFAQAEVRAERPRCSTGNVTDSTQINPQETSEDEEVERVVVKSGLEVATELVKFWNRYGYNGYANADMNDVELSDDRKVDVYSYVNTEEVVNLTEYENVVPGMVLGYLVNGEALYTALMPL